MEFLQNDLLGSLLEFLDTMDYGNLLSVSKLLHEKSLKYKKTKFPFTVVEIMWTGDGLLSTECIDEFYKKQTLKFDTNEKISKNMSSHLHQLLFAIIAKMGYPFYTVPWRFRKCIDCEMHHGSYYMKINTEVYITSCLEKCDNIIKDTPVAKRKEMEATLFQKIMRKHKKSKTMNEIEMEKFNAALHKKFSKQR
jgi:hypothetical protein